MTDPRRCIACGVIIPASAPACPTCRRPLPTFSDEPTVTSDPFIGTVVGQYKVCGRLGAGGMGVVYEAVNPIIDKHVALKVLQPDLAESTAEMERFIAEARAANAIGHRSIVDIYDSGKLSDGRQYLVMELLKGEPLDRLIALGAPMALDTAIPLLQEICEALHAAHGTGVIHRDLKPSNVFVVTPQFGARYVKLLDFGLAKRTLIPGGNTPQTRGSMVVGTPFYMSPEQARMEPVGPFTDLYALGVVAFEMVTGRLPFHAPTPFEVVTMHLRSPAPRASAVVSGLPPAFDDLIFNLMRKVPAERPASAQVVALILEGVRSALPPGSTRPVLIEPLPPPVPDTTSDLQWSPTPVEPAKAAVSGVITGALKRPPITTPEASEKTDVVKRPDSTTHEIPVLAPRRPVLPIAALGFVAVVVAGTIWVATRRGEVGPPPPATDIKKRKPEASPPPAKVVLPPLPVDAPTVPPAPSKEPDRPPTAVTTPTPAPEQPGEPPAVPAVPPKKPDRPPSAATWPAPEAEEPVKPPPSETRPPKPATPSVSSSRPARPPRTRAPTREALLERIAKLEAQLRASVAPGEEVNRAALLFLDGFRKNVQADNTEASRRKVSESLDRWKSKYGDAR